MKGSLICAGLLRRDRDAVITALIAGDRQPRNNRFGESPELFRQRVGESLDLLIGHLEGRADFDALYVGQRLFELFELERTRAENLEACRASVGEDGAVFRSFLASRVTAEALADFETSYRELTAGLVKEATRHVSTLFVGDCLIAETLSFLVGPLLGEGISIEPFAVNARDLAQLRQRLGKLASRNVEIVVFSPFSHARMPEMEALMSPGRMPKAEVDGLVDAILAQTQSFLDELADRYECPIFVHNAAFVPRASSAAKAGVRLALSHRARHHAGERINRWLDDYVARRNASTFQHLFVLDENALAHTFGRLALGRFLNASEFQHATVLSRRLAPLYRSRIGAVGQLLGKKLVVCDLDNTLWQGVIGEGPVSHFAERQQSLKRLKDHAGVVLSIASKNEPANVKFDGGVLALEDFVAPQISWNPKAAAISQIKSRLNLQTRHMVFLDDRPDERALVREAFPDLLALDPCDPETWERIDLWGAMAYGSSDLDRTRMYQEQAVRDSVIEPAAEADGAASVETLKKLGLVISIRRAQRGDLKRVAELINRTNQWNLCGSRTSFEQLRAWHESADAHILLASASDRFGDMGVVCVSVVTEESEIAQIPIFVLSCRVFGYGVETAMLREIGRRTGIGVQRKALIGHFRSNAQNHPCRNMYAEHGFAVEESVFRWGGTPEMPAVPWAEVVAV